MGRILDRSALAAALAEERRGGQRIVFTNGCFDLIHAGHIRYLRDAKALGDLLVVGVNSDESVRRLGKGMERPILAQAERAEILAALEMVDYVSIFGEDTPVELIQTILPDVLVKGGDWAPESIAGADIVKSRGGRVESVAYHPGLSTSEIIRRIRGE